MTGLRAKLTRWLLLYLLLPGLAAAQQGDATDRANESNGSNGSDANAAAGEKMPVRHISGPNRQDQTLVRQNPDAMRWLATGDGRFPVMETESARPKSRGTVILVADAGQSPAQGLTGQLHRVLPAMGWHVMSLGLPPIPLPAREVSTRSSTGTGSDDEKDGMGNGNDAEQAQEPQASEPGAENKADSITIDLATPEPSADDAQRFETQAQARIKAAIASVQKHPPGIRVLVGIGLGAAPLTRYLAEARSLAESSPAGSEVALVWILPRFQDIGAGGDADLPEAWLEGGRPWPILEITDHSDRQRQAKARRAALQRLDGDAPYRQDALTMAPDGAGEGDRLGRRIHSWAVRQFP